MSTQMKYNFKIQKFLSKPYIACPVLSLNSKNVIYFDVRQLEMPKRAFPNSDVNSFVIFFGHCRAKNKYNTLIFTLDLNIRLHNTNRFLDRFKILYFMPGI